MIPFIPYVSLKQVCNFQDRLKVYFSDTTCFDFGKVLFDEVP